MPDTPEPPADNIALLLRLGLEEEPEMADPNATIMVTAPAPRTGSSGQSGGGGGSRGWSPPSVEELQQALPQYEISAFIARGGMGAVYKGMQKTLKRAVAIKVLPPEMGDDTGDLQFAARFKHEAQAMAQLSHPNIVAVFDAGEVVLGETLRQGEGETGRAGGVLLYFVMEFIEGTDVAQLIASEGVVEPRRAIQITTAVCEALAFAHEEGIIHRDIKPSNIMLDRKGRVKVADFGLAKTVSLDATLLTGTNLAMGTPDFIAPEAMIPGIKVDGRADLYAVGVMLYQMLTGTIPRGRFELPSGVVPQMNKGFDAVVDKAMQTDREKRYSTAMEMKKDVESVAAAPHPLPQAVPPTSDSSRQGGEAAKPKGRDGGGKVSKSRKHLIALGAAAALGFGGWMLWQGGAAGPPAAAETAKAALGGPSALPKAPAPPQAAWVPMYRQTAELAPLFGKPQTLYLDFQSHAALVQDPASGLKLADGWLMPTTTTHVKLPLPSARNAGVRMRVQMSEPTHTASIWLRGVDRGAVYAASWRGINRYFSTASKAAEYLTERKNFVAKKPGESFTLEFYAIGRDLIFRYDGEVIRVREPGEDPAIGTLNHLMIRNPVTDIEFINLDGLSEAEALKLAGADSTVPPIAAAASPATQGSAAPAFPPGQWTKVLSTQAEVDALVGLKGKVTVKPDGWLDFSGPEVAPGVGLMDFSAANAGVRVKGRIADREPLPVVVMLTLRHTTSPPPRTEGYRLHITGGETANPSISLAHYDNSTRKTTHFKTMLRPGKLKAGEEYSLELYTIGSRLFGRFNGGPLLQAEDQRLTRGVLTLQTGHLLRDIEVINLDGLSEAEALKVAGLDSVVLTTAAVPTKKALGGIITVPSNPGRLEGTGTMANGKPPELAKFAAYDDFVDVAGSSDFLMALRANGETVSSDGQADFQGIRRIARSFQGYHCFITETGELRFHAKREMPLPPSLKGRKVVDAACGSHHGVALLEGGQAVVFGKRYEEAMDDMSKRDGTGTPRWPQPEAAALQKVKGVAVTYTHAATLHEDGTVSVWGWEGPVKWQPEAKMKPVRQISSHHDNLHLLDEAGQVWSFPMPRSAHPEQPVGFNGTVKPLGTAAVRLRDHLWLGADGAWHGVAADLPVQELLERTDLQPETNFALLSSTANAIPFSYVLWIEPVAPAGATVSPSPSLPVSTSLPPFTDREAAEWVLGLGQDTCSVTVRTLNGGKVTQVRKLADLPAEPFVIVEFKGSVLHTKSPELWGKVTDAVVLRLAGLRSLQLVDLRGNVTGASLKVMAHHPGLEALQFEGRNLKAGDLLHLRASRLQSLGIPLLRVAAPDSLAVLATMPNLRVLQFNESFDPALAAALPKLPKLEILRANSSDTLTDDVLPLLAERLPQLTLLQLWSSQKLKGSTLGSLTALKDLTTLGLTDTSVNDETLAQIAGMPQILSLELGQTRITDACLPTLKSFPKLESMHIFQTELTDAALLELASIPTLKKLVVKTSGYSDYKPKVTFTEAGIAAFQKLRPDVQVVK